MNDKYALISVSDKRNLDELVEVLNRCDYKIIATTSTAKYIENLEINTIAIDDIASYTEMLDGRVKTLQPEIHAGILADLDKSNHLKDLSDNGIKPISVVVCNLYPFEKVLNASILSDEDKSDEIIENIDIGGITLLRASAKNHKFVSVLCDPNDYHAFSKKLEENIVSVDYRKMLAKKAFITTANYDMIIAKYFMNDSEEKLFVGASLNSVLRYGENPHQEGFYYEENKTSFSLASSEIIQGKALSYNNILDIDAAFKSIRDFDTMCAISLKHNTICGIGFDENLYQAYMKCYETDGVSIFGGIVIFNAQVDEPLAKKLSEIFLEIIIAPSFSDEALKVFAEKKNLIIIQGNFEKCNRDEIEIRSINDGFLKQRTKSVEIKTDVVTKDKNISCEKELCNLYNVVKTVKSNGIVIGQGDLVLGISGGMVSRIDACEFAINKAYKHPKYNSDKALFIASDGFFPFNDIVDFALMHNITHIIQPGGSINDKKLIAACDENDITMIFTGVRYFRH